MAKKSSSHRQRPAQSARGAASKAPSSAATLVRANRPDAASGDATRPANAAPRPSAASVVRDTPAAPARPAPKPATAVKPSPAPLPPAKPAASPAPTAAPSKRVDTRVTRARATQRARQAGLISAENYSYVLQDLKLVGVLAAAAVVILVALAFTLPH